MFHSFLTCIAQIGLDFVHIGIFLVGVVGFAFASGCLLSSIVELGPDGKDFNGSDAPAMFGGCLFGAVIGFILNLCLCVNSTVGSAFMIMLGICIVMAVLIFIFSILGNYLQRRRARSSDSDSSLAQ